ncbi:serine/threonine protein kinase [Streptomyces sp. A1277]|uniref:serine/threonine-protein kinase n=1 Tax=Streptomyces sp. A1277 TaxID=2563103 RepID=UPI0010A2284B|nr:serine/threonine-protein kinase [Streptomyces sp. A1277]THA31756.1 serine/threonine protein kinase [Streptomyces sp. A1277]
MFEIRQGHVLNSRYRLDGPLRAGGMGMVWRAYDVRLSRVVAVKFANPAAALTFQDRDEMLKRFQQEAGVAARFTNTGVASVYDVGEDRPYSYLVMELVQGSTLDELMDECGPLELSVAASIIVPICAVLAAAHRAGIVHRDLKPSNVMVSEQGHTKVLDFGIARVEGAAVDTRLTRTGRNPGSPGYMSPEQYEGKQVTGRSDLYALGCLLYEMLAGRPVFPQDDEFALRHMHTTVTPDALGGLREGLPEAVLNLVDRLLAKDPADRPASADEVNRILRVYLPASGDDPPDDYVFPDPTRPFRLPFAPEDVPLTGPRVELPGTVSRTYRARADAKDLHHEVRRLLGTEPAKAVDLLRERLPDLAEQYGLRAHEVLDLRFDLAEAVLVQVDREEARDLYAAIRQDTADVDGLEMYRTRAEEGIARCG